MTAIFSPDALCLLLLPGLNIQNVSPLRSGNVVILATMMKHAFVSLGYNVGVALRKRIFG